MDLKATTIVALIFVHNCFSFLVILLYLFFLFRFSYTIDLVNQITTGMEIRRFEAEVGDEQRASRRVPSRSQRRRFNRRMRGEDVVAVEPHSYGLGNHFLFRLPAPPRRPRGALAYINLPPIQPVWTAAWATSQYPAQLSPTPMDSTPLTPSTEPRDRREAATSPVTWYTTREVATSPVQWTETADPHSSGVSDNADTASELTTPIVINVIIVVDTYDPRRDRRSPRRNSRRTSSCPTTRISCSSTGGTFTGGYPSCVVTSTGGGA